jgi:hypothetical protein
MPMIAPSHPTLDNQLPPVFKPIAPRQMPPTGQMMLGAEFFDSDRAGSG